MILGPGHIKSEGCSRERVLKRDFYVLRTVLRGGKTEI